MKDIMDSISGDEALHILKILCSSNSELRERIEAEAEKLLRDFAPDEIADGVLSDLDMMDVEELWDRSGASRHGYSSPDEMAAEMVEEALNPYEEKIREYAKIGMAEQSMRYCMGVLEGIYRFEHESKTEFKDWASDIPGECFGAILDEWRRSCIHESDLEKMDAFISRECPKWANWAAGTERHE